MKEGILLFFSRYRKESILFFSAFLLRLIAFIVFSYLTSQYGVLTNSERHRYPIIGVDAGGYVATARVLVEEGRFASPGIVEPQSYQMPIYPFFLAAVIAVSGNISLVVILQAVIAGFSAILIFKIGSSISPRIGGSAAALFAVDPIGIFYSTVILTETLFIFFLLLSVYFYLKYFGERWRSIFVSSAFAGVATLIRPSAIVMPPIFMLGILLWQRGNTRRMIILLFLAIIGFLIVIFPWMARNKLYFDSWDLSAVATTQWFQQSAPLYYAHVNGVSHSEAYEVFRARLMEINPRKSDEGTLRNTPYMRQVIKEYISQDLFGYAYFHAVKTLPFFFSDGLRDIARRLELVDTDQPNIGSLVLARDISGLRAAVLQNGLSSALLLIGGSVWFFIAICMIAGVIGIRASLQATIRVILLCFFIVLATAVIAGGPNASARYRFSVSPFIFIIASYGFFVLYDRITTKYE